MKVMLVDDLGEPETRDPQEVFLKLYQLLDTLYRARADNHERTVSCLVWLGDKDKSQFP